MEKKTSRRKKAKSDTLLDIGVKGKPSTLPNETVIGLYGAMTFLLLDHVIFDTASSVQDTLSNASGMQIKDIISSIITERGIARCLGIPAMVKGDDLKNVTSIEVATRNLVKDQARLLYNFTKKYAISGNLMHLPPNVMKSSLRATLSDKAPPEVAREIGRLVNLSEEDLLHGVFGPETANRISKLTDVDGGSLEACLIPEPVGTPTEDDIRSAPDTVMATVFLELPILSSSVDIFLMAIEEIQDAPGEETFRVKMRAFHMLLRQFRLPEVKESLSVEANKTFMFQELVHKYAAMGAMQAEQYFPQEVISKDREPERVEVEFAVKKAITDHTENAVKLVDNITSQDKDGKVIDIGKEMVEKCYESDWEQKLNDLALKKALADDERGLKPDK